MSDTDAVIENEVSTDGSNTRRLTWETRVMQASPFGVMATAVVVAVSVFLSYLVVTWWTGLPVVVIVDNDPTLSTDAWTALCMALLWGSIFGLGEYTRTNNLTDLQLLQGTGVVVDADQIDILRFGPMRATRNRALVFGVMGACAGTLFYNLAYQPDGHIVDILNASLTNYWFIFMTLALFVEIFRNLSYLRADTMSFLGDLDNRIEIDLFDVDKLDPLGRIALRRSLPWLVSSAIVLLMMFGLSSSILFWILCIGLMINAALVFSLPMWRVHRLIDSEKNRELRKLRADVGRAREVFALDKSANATSHLTALLTLEARVENVREWPLDLSTIVRFAFYLALPLGSWLGGALVERGLDLVTR
tara:strand:- start:2587 stop:3672 length:1086 start_codon:yes stop_codon:yes gene_type:complete